MGIAMSLESVSAEMVILEPTVKLVGVFSSLHSNSFYPRTCHVSTNTFMFLMCFILVFPYLRSHVSRPDSVPEGKPLFSGGNLLQ